MEAWGKIFLVAAAMTLPPCVSGQQNAPVTLSISAPSTVLKVGEQVRLEVIAKNSSGQMVKIYTASGKPNGGEAEDYNGIDVRDAQGKMLPRIDGRPITRRDGTIMRTHGLFSLRPVALAPGEQFRDFTVLNRLFDLTKPGTYTVTVKQEIRLDNAVPEPMRATSTSNTLTITIVAPATSQ